MKPLEIKYILALFLLIMLFKGCGIFETRDPQDPQNIRSTYIPPTSADIVIDNLAITDLTFGREYL